MAEFYHSSREQELIENDLELVGHIEAILFVAPTALSITQIASLLETTPSIIVEGLARLESIYINSDGERGLRIQRHGNRVQLTTAPQSTKVIEKLLGLEVEAKLSKAALEALAIVAYKQPITRPYIDSIRGVNSDGVLKSLLSKGLINEVGRTNSPGRPILYGTTTDFLQHFGLNSISDLPPLSFEGNSDDENGESLNQKY